MYLLPEGIGIPPCDNGGVYIFTHRGAFGGEPEGIPAHRVHDVIPLHAPEIGEDIGGDIVFRVPHVQPRAGGVREHA